ncbi:MAG TPA: ABC transporter substrate-binding protein [Nocardioidaceae bacterium]|nr:ABC transporter substrate-binding protein [Nocardioidaceae bacterium]
MRIPARSRAALAAVALLSLLAGCGGSSGGTTSGGAELVAADTLTVCSDVPYPPFETFDKSSELGFSGFDIELANQIAQGLDLKLAVQDVGFETLQSGQVLAAGQCDMGASAMTITPERAKNLTFSDPYYDSKQSLLVFKDSGIKTLDDLVGKKVGVQQGTTGQRYAEENLPEGATPVAYPSDGELYPALQAHQIDAILQDYPVNLSHVQANDKLAIVQQYDTNEQYGFAFAKDNTALADEVNAQLKKLRDNGEYQKLFDKYFSLEQ